MNPLEASTNPHVLFLCLGNICRSPLAEGAFRHAIAAAGLDARVDSAGTGGWHAGERPDHRSIAVAREHGVDISGQRARPLEDVDFSTFDWIVAMDADNLRTASRMRPSGRGHERARLVPFIDFVPPEFRKTHTGVPDPYYGDIEQFREVWRLLGHGMPQLIAAVYPLR
jgi:protein-tyrosine phosphatase